MNCTLYTKVNVDAVYVHTYVIAFCIRHSFHIIYFDDHLFEYIHNIFIPGCKMVSLDILNLRLYNCLYTCRLTECIKWWHKMALNPTGFGDCGLTN